MVFVQVTKESQENSRIGEATLLGLPSLLLPEVACNFGQGNTFVDGRELHVPVRIFGHSVVLVLNECTCATLGKNILLRICQEVDLAIGQTLILRCGGRVTRNGSLAEATVTEDMLEVDVVSIGGMSTIEEDQAELEVLLRRVKILEASIAQATLKLEAQVLDENMYLTKMVEKMDSMKEIEDIDIGRAEEAIKQTEVLKLLMGVKKSRLEPETITAHGQKAVLFSASMDDDEVLLSFFKELDIDGSLTISKEELCQSNHFKNNENQAILKVLLCALECNLGTLLQALAHLEACDFGPFVCKNHSQTLGETVFDLEATVKRVYGAAIQKAKGNSATSTVSGDDTQVISKADLESFIGEVTTLLGTGSCRLVMALKKLANSLPSEGELDFLAFKAAARKVPRVAGHRMAWVGTLGLDAALARHLPPGTLEDG